MVERKRLIKLTQELIRIDSQNPPGDESRVASFVENYLKGLGLKVRIYEFKKKRTNIIATLAGKNKKQSLLLTPHLDTVPAGASWKRHPFAAKVYKDKIYGLGATDCKGNLAAGLEAIRSLVEEGAVLGYNLVFAATADEESGSDLGLIPLLRKGILRPDAALVLDSDDFEIIITQKGLLHLKIKVEGKRAHGAYPWLGVNAIEKAINIIGELKKRGLRQKKNKYLMPPTMNVGTIKGGDKVNIVADWCEFELDLRFLPGSEGRDLLAQVKSVVKKHAKKYSIEIGGMQKPYALDKSHPLIGYLSKAIKMAGAKPRIKGSEGATVVTFFHDLGIAAAATGFGSSGCAHTADEYAKIDNLYKGAKALEIFLKIYKFPKERKYGRNQNL